MTLSHGVMKSDASSTQIDYLPFRELPKVMESMIILQLWAASITVNNQAQDTNQ